MTQAASASRPVSIGARLLDRASVVALWLGASSMVFVIWLFHDRKFNTFPPAKAERMVYGGANRPFSSRLLVPWLTRGIVAPLPVDLRRAWVDGLIEARPGVERLIEYFDTRRDFAVELFVVAKLDYAALVGFMIALYLLFGTLYRGPPWVARLAPVVAVLVLPVFFREGTRFLYDFPALFLFTLALWLVRTERRRWLWLVLALGALNKETIAFVPLAFLLWQWNRWPRGRLLRELGLQVGVVAVARVAAVALSSPASDAERNDYLRDFLGLNLLDFVGDPLLLDYTRVAALLFLVWLIGRRFAGKPEFLRRTLPVALPFFLAFLWGSRWGEIRALYEIYPILFLLGYQTLVEELGSPLRPAAEDEPPAPPQASGWLASAAALACGLGCFAPVIVILQRFLGGP